jgi:hypothetical protein
MFFRETVTHKRSIGYLCAVCTLEREHLPDLVIKETLIKTFDALLKPEYACNLTSREN